MMRPMHHADVARVAALHEASLPGDFLAMLGVDFLRAFYLELLEPGVGFGYVWICDDQVVGFISGTRHSGSFAMRMLRRHPWRLLRALARGGLKQPRVIMQAAHTARHLLGSSRTVEGPMIRANAVHPEFRRRGIGLQLYRQALQRFHELGFASCRTRVSAEEPAVHRLWERVGGRVERSLTLAGRRIDVYYFELAECLRSATLR